MERQGQQHRLWFKTFDVSYVKCKVQWVIMHMFHAQACRLIALKKLGGDLVHRHSPKASGETLRSTLGGYFEGRRATSDEADFTDVNRVLIDQNKVS